MGVNRTQAKTIKEELLKTKTTLSDIIFSPVYLAFNFALGAIGLDCSLNQDQKSLKRLYSPRARYQTLKTNVKGIKTLYFKDPVKKISESWATHLNKLTVETSAFATLNQSLTEPDQLTAVAEQKTSFDQTTQTLNEEFKQFHQRIDTLLTLLDPQTLDDARLVLPYITHLYNDLITKLDNARTNRLEDIDAIATALSTAGVPETNIQTLKNDLTKAINAAYVATKADLEKDFKTGVAADPKDEKNPGTAALETELKRAAQRAEAELINLVCYTEYSSSKMLIETNPARPGAAIGAADQGEKYRLTSLVDYMTDRPLRKQGFFSLDAWYQWGKFFMNNAGDVTTPSGLRIQASNNGFQITFPNSWSLYYHYNDNQLMSDMTILVNNVVATGKTAEITFTLTCLGDPELRKKTMQAFYRCASLAGYPDDKIIFNISGCPAATNDEEKKAISNKTAAELMGGILGNAKSLAEADKRKYDTEENNVSQERDFELEIGRKELSERIDRLIPKEAHEEEAVLNARLEARR